MASQAHRASVFPRPGEGPDDSHGPPSHGLQYPQANAIPRHGMGGPTETDRASPSLSIPVKSGQGRFNTSPGSMGSGRDSVGCQASYRTNRALVCSGSTGPPGSPSAARGL